MIINVKGYKNIEDLSYAILDSKLNVLVGVSGSGKSSIVGALKNDDLEFHKKVDFIGAVSATINGATINPDDISVFSESSLSKYLFEETRNESIYNVLIDNDSEFQRARNKLEVFLSGVENEFNVTDIDRNTFTTIQSQLGAKLTSTNKLRASSPIKRMEKSLNNLTKKRFYSKIQTLDTNLVTWRVKGEPLIMNSICPYCDKKLSIKKEEELREYSNIDVSSFGKVDLDANQLSILKSPRVIMTTNGMSRLENEIISIGIALNEYEKLKQDVHILFDTDLDVNRISDFNYDSSLYVHFPSLKDKVRKLRNQTRRLKGTVIATQNKTKAILNRKLNSINKLLKSFGIPYEIQAKYRQSRIESYKLYHTNDTKKVERMRGLSTGERKIISIIFYILEMKNDNKSLIVLDDPVSSYDENRRFSLFKYILSELKGKTLLILSHDQSFAKYACISKSTYIGNVEYFSNWNNTSATTSISTSDFDNINTYIKERLNITANYIQKIINLRYYYEINKKGKVYTYLSRIIHKADIPSWLSNKGYLEVDILDQIKNDVGVILNPFNSTSYLNIDTSTFSVIEKIFILREKIGDKILKGEISNFIHLNTAYVMTMNPYKYPFCSNYLLNEIQSNITPIISL